MTVPPTHASRGPLRRLWDRACRASLSRGRISRQALERFCRQHASGERTLVVHCVDIHADRYFPDRFVVCSRESKPADLRADADYQVLSDLPDGSYDSAVCTGLLEHVPDPQRVVDDLHRILRPGGRLIVSASAVFPFHGGERNYFHFTYGGFRRLFRNWSDIPVLRGSGGPYTTLAILFQRINIQTDAFPPVRLFNDVMYRVLPWFDRFVYRQYLSGGDREAGRTTDSVMPATLHAVIVK